MARPGAAAVQYGDVRGEVAGDLSDRLGNSLQRAASELGFRGPGFVVGMSIWGGDDSVHPETVRVTFEVADLAGVDRINQELEDSGGELVVKEYCRSNVPFLDFVRVFKRLNVAFFSRHIGATEITVAERIHLDDQEEA
jgi:hypothetical protein